MLVVVVFVALVFAFVFIIRPADIGDPGVSGFKCCCFPLLDSFTLALFQRRFNLIINSFCSCNVCKIG